MMPRGNRTIRRLLGAGAAVLLLATSAAAEDGFAGAIATIKGIGREGDRNADAQRAWKTLVARGSGGLVPILAAFDEANPTAMNWLRPAVDAIAENEAKAGRPLPVAALETFAKDQKYAPSARRLAYELIVKDDPAAKGRLLAGFLNDPSPDLRRDAVAAELAKIEKGTGLEEGADLKKLLGFARDKDQVETIAKKLEAEYKVRVSIPEHFGFVTHWHLIGPFESSQGKALTTTDPAARATDVSGKFPGKGGAELTWKPHVTADRYAVVDLNKALGKNMDAAAYALAVIVAEQDTPAEFRAATPNAVQIFVNGTKLFEREEYHHGATLDYHIGKGMLRKGENIVVLKIAQNNQKDSWAQDWKFQLRVCDVIGAPLPGVTQTVPCGPKSIKLGALPETAANKEEKK